MSKVYDNLKSMFDNVAAYAITEKGSNCINGRIIFKFMPSGVVHAFVHEWGFECVQGKASGGGYDKRSSAVLDAVERAPEHAKDSPLYKALKTMQVHNGADWDSVLRDKGYSIQFIL